MAGTQNGDEGTSEKLSSTARDNYVYEQFLRDVHSDFNDRVLSVQRKAEESVQAYESSIQELKLQIEELTVENEALKRMSPQDQDGTLKLLSVMTGLSVHLVSHSGCTQRFSCEVVDGLLKGHCFTLTMDHHSKQCTYHPEGSQLLLNSLQDATRGFNLTQKIIFPEYMLSRFLMNILHTSYSI